MKRPTSLPVLVQVAALAALAVAMSQGVAFGVVVLAPEPRPAGFSIDAAARALKGQEAVTSDGRALRRKITNEPVKQSQGDLHDPIALAITTALADKLQAPAQSVRVSVDRGAPARRGMLRTIAPLESDVIFVPSDTPVAVAPPPPGVPAPVTVTQDREGMTLSIRRSVNEGTIAHATTRQITVLTDRLTFAPFAASVQQEDGRWATVEPPRGLLSPWQRRLLLALSISMLLLAPLVWWMARRLTRPIRAFAAAAERLGADPEADPLAASGPSEVRTAIHAFNDMQASLRNHMRQRTQTIAAIAHDLRTPLTRLRFRAEQAPDDIRDRMALDIEEMDALIGQAMAFVRGETATERREPMDLDALAADCAAGFAETGADVGFDGGGSLPVLADPAALRRALDNLIANAVQYGGTARVKAFAEGVSAVILVEDHGPGLLDEELEAAFEPFHRGERSRSRETGGAGLGLTVARQAARAHGGDVTLSNRPTGGLAARLVLPLQDR